LTILQKMQFGSEGILASFLCAVASVSVAS